MAILISSTDVKRKAMIADSNTVYDTKIASLISEIQGPLEYSIADIYFNDTSNVKLQATLRLGILEIITGEFLEQLRREVGSTEQFSVGGITMGESKVRGVDLIQQGATRLSSYLKSALPMMSNTVCSSSTSDRGVTFSLDEEVW